MVLFVATNRKIRRTYVSRVNKSLEKKLAPRLHYFKQNSIHRARSYQFLYVCFKP